jgi:pimeloyl-ACP methyl ester carboxylesterase
MKLIKAFTRQIKILLKRVGENLDNYEFSELTDKQLKVSKFGTHRIIDLSDANKDQIKKLQIDEVNELVKIGVAYNEADIPESTNSIINSIGSMVIEAPDILEEIIESVMNDIVKKSEYDVHECMANWVGQATTQLKLYEESEPLYEANYTISNGNFTPPVSLDHLHFKTTNVVSTSWHTLKAYTVSSRADGLDILLVPGYLNSHAIYTNILTDGWVHNLHNVYVFDPRGQGGSDKPDLNVGRYGSAEQRADDINSVILELGLTNVVLVGHSHGWLQIGDYLNKYGQSSIRGLICIDGLPEMDIKFFNSIYLGHLTTFTHAVPLCYTDQVNDVANLLQHAFINDPGAHFKILMTADLLSVDRSLRLPILAHESTNYVTGVKPLWSTVTLPTLIQWGEHDNVLNFQCAKELYRAMPLSTLKLYNAKHYPFIDDQDTFMINMRRFLYDLLNSIKKVDNNSQSLTENPN